MIDIQLTNSGDISVARNDPVSHLNIKWVYGPKSLSAFNIKFEVTRNTLDPEEKDLGGKAFRINFYTSSSKSRSECRTCLQQDELRQRVLILLRTELGDISTDSGYGTDLQLQRHLDITDDKVITAVRETVTKALDGYLTNPSVIVNKRIIDGPFFCQNLNVYVYEGKTEIYNFSLEA